MCIRDLQHATGLNKISLHGFYDRFEARLESLHPENRNVQAKIRQQLQVLRDNNILEFAGRGYYQILK